MGMLLFSRSREQIDVKKKPVGYDDQSFDAAVQQHFQIAFETAALVVDVGQHGQVVRLVERVFDAAKNQVQKGSVMSKTMTPTVWLRLLRSERANWLGR